MIGLRIKQVATDESVQCTENSDFRVCKIKIQQNVCFFTQTFDSLKIFPKFNLHWIMVRSMYLNMLFTRRGFPLIITLLQF